MSIGKVLKKTVDMSVLNQQKQTPPEKKQPIDTPQVKEPVRTEPKVVQPVVQEVEEIEEVVEVIEESEAESIEQDEPVVEVKPIKEAEAPTPRPQATENPIQRTKKIYMPLSVGKIPADIKEAQEQRHEKVKKSGLRLSRKTAYIDYLPPEFDDVPTTARSIARPDLPADYYRYQPTDINFKMYNRHLEDALSSFKKDNAALGGVSISKAHLIELICDFVMYDMELEPMGFISTEHVREYLRSKLK